MSAALSLRQLLSGIVEPSVAGEHLASGLCLDSRRVRPGDAFVALRGSVAHGLTHAAEAARRGARVVLAEPPLPQGLHSPLPVILVEHLREHLGEVAARLYGQPSAAMTVIGVTGTNGKTSTVQMLGQALDHLGHRAATIGTLGAGFVGHETAGERTTPDAISVQALLAELRIAGASHVAMEVSSHALDQGRVNAVHFHVAAFTNLTRDHLDYHGSMEAYGAAKARLFRWPGLHTAVINVDDGYGHELAGHLPQGVQRLRVSIGGAHAELHAEAMESGPLGIAFDLVTPWGAARINSRLLGRFNVANMLLVAACLGALDHPFGHLVEALHALRPVRGRMSRLGGSGGRPLLVIDYAHTPDALEQALTNLRAHCAGRLTCVFGCGGERDQGKRPYMGAIAERLADHVVVTDDNPRGEDGDIVVAQILAGMERPAAAAVERDRAAAIRAAVASAAADDVVLIAGKGHEAYQEVAGEKRPFDDLAVAREALEGLSC